MKFIRLTSMLAGMGIAAGILLAPVVASAASATLLVSPASGTYDQGSTFSVTIAEDSGANSVDSARAELTYDAGSLQVVGFSTAGNPFTTCVSSGGASGGSITTGDCTLLGGKKQGYQTLATVTFKVLAGNGSAALTFNGSSQLVNSGTDLSWVPVNGSYSFTTPSTGGGSGSSSGNGGSNNGSSSSGSGSGSSNTSSGSTGTTSGKKSSPAQQTTSGNGAVAGENTAQNTQNAETTATAEDVQSSTKKATGKKDETTNTAKKSNSKVWLWLVLIAAVAAAYYYAIIRRRAGANAAADAVSAKDADDEVTIPAVRPDEPKKAAKAKSGKKRRRS